MQIFAQYLSIDIDSARARRPLNAFPLRIAWNRREAEQLSLGRTCRPQPKGDLVPVIALACLAGHRAGYATCLHFSA